MSDDAPFLLDVTRLVWRRWKGRQPTGIDRVALAYLDHFGSRSQAVLQHDRFRRILDFKASQQLFALLRSRTTSFKPRLVASALSNLLRFRGNGKGRLYLNVGHTGLNSAGFRNWVGSANVRPVYLVHDLIPITHPQFARAGEDRRHRERMITVLTTGTGVIGNSRTTLDELAKFAAAEHLPMPPAVTAWLGTEPLPPAAPRNETNTPTFVTLGTIEGRKNHSLLLDIWSRLAERLGDQTPRLLIIGQRGWEAEDVFRRLDRDETIRNHVIELNHCCDEELAKHLSSAQALLFPSFVEGYGLPLIEALAAGVPVIASDLPVFRELCGNIPIYLEPMDGAAWEEAILEHLSVESGTRAAKLPLIQQFRPMDWHQHFEIVESFLTELG